MPFLIALAALSPLIAWSLWAACKPHHPQTAPTTGAEFAAAHGNDSSTWTAADFDAEFVFAEIDLQPAWLIAHPKPAPETTPAA